MMMREGDTKMSMTTNTKKEAQGFGMSKMAMMSTTMMVMPMNMIMPIDMTMMPAEPVRKRHDGFVRVFDLSSTTI